MKIIVTDDSEQMVSLYKAIFAGHEVVRCWTMDELKQFGPTADVIIADYDTYVPFEAVAALNRPTVLVTGRMERLWDLQLTKPTTRKELLEMVERAVNALERSML